MARVRSNYEAVASAIRRLPNALDYDARLPGGRRLGALLAEAIAIGIFKRSMGRQVDPEGNAWDPLSPAYLRWKIKHGYSPRKNVKRKSGGMLSLDEIRGTARITKHRVDLTYGRSPETQQLAEWAERGQAARNRPPRPFYGIDSNIEAQLDAIVAAALDDVIREAGGS